MADNPQLDDATAARLGRMFAGMAHHDKGRKLAAKLVKETMPDSPEARSFADVEQEDRFEAFKAEQEAKEIERQKQDVVARMDAQRRRLLSGGSSGCSGRLG